MHQNATSPRSRREISVPYLINEIFTPHNIGFGVTRELALEAVHKLIGSSNSGKDPTTPLVPLDRNAQRTRHRKTC
uniref:Uncharacterized protein n=1 Tax=Nelumbo nucifera TaxID=4432 RepID=A0A822Y7J8_NELNU|nr:TPA_asm: hypothetical protein HUJ06_029885 [Nelumbo nucifera]